MPWRKTKRGGYTKIGATRGRGGFVRNPKQYEALRKKGMPKSQAAAITNAKKRRKKK